MLKMINDEDTETDALILTHNEAYVESETLLTWLIINLRHILCLLWFRRELGILGALKNRRKI